MSTADTTRTDATVFFGDRLATADPELLEALTGELARQQAQIELIASENIVSRAVLEAQGSVLTNKYAEGYPGRRYYGGCEYVDVAERLAIERATRLFDCGFANVQPHSGAQANQAVFLALLKPGDTILGMSLDAGGHLTHGAAPNQSGKWFNAIGYGVRESDGLIDYDRAEELAREHRPKIVIAGGSAYSRIIDFARFRAIADSVGAFLMVDMAHFAGLVAGGVYPSPLPHAHVVTTTTHKTLRGPRGGMVLSVDVDLGKKINSAVFPGLQGGPLMHVIAAKAVAFGEAMKPDFRAYAGAVVDNAKALAATLEERGFRTFALMDQLEEMQKGFIIMDMFLLAVGMIGITVASLGIVNTMVMSILERYREIGIMKAVGATDGDVQKIFLFESGMIGLLGGAFGLTLAWVVSVAINAIINSFSSRQGVPYIQYFNFPWWLCLGAITFSILVSLIAGVYPTLRAARVDPVVALRHD